MYDVKKRLNYIKLMQKGRIPKEYQHDGNSRKYRSECEKYDAIHKEISKCSKQELNNMEILLKNEMDDGKRLNDFKNILPLAVSGLVVYIVLCLCPSTLFQRPGVGRAHEPL